MRNIYLIHSEQWNHDDYHSDEACTLSDWQEYIIQSKLILKIGTKCRNYDKNNWQQKKKQTNSKIDFKKHQKVSLKSAE